MASDTILGIDPGLRAMGIALLGPRARLRYAAEVTVPADLTLRRRLDRLAAQIDDVLVLFRPGLVAIEATWPSTNPSLALLHRAGQRLTRTVAARGIRLVSLPSTTVRRRLLGDGWAKKRDTARLLARRYPELRIYLSRDRYASREPFGDLFDAVAVALAVRKGPDRA